jgi:uncharacterized membrane protein YbhN (UPF0104 family)
MGGGELTTTEARTAASFDDEPVEIIEPDPERYVRAAGDVIQAGIALGLFLVTLLVAAVLRTTVVSGAQQDVLHLTSLVAGSDPNGPVRQLLLAVVSAVAYFGPVILAAELIFIRRFRLALMVFGAGVLAWFGMWLVSRLLSINVVLPGNVGQLQEVTTTEAPWVAAAAAMVTVINPWLPRVLRRTGIAIIAVVVLTNMATGTYVPYEAAVAVMLGWLCGSLVLAVCGSANRRPRGAAVARALRGADVPVTRLELIGRGERGSSIYRADTTGGDVRFVKVFDPNQRETDMLLQFYRWVRLRDPGERRPFSSLRRAVEHETLITLAVEQEAVPAPDVVAVCEVEPEGMLLTLEFIEGDDLVGRGPDGVDDELLRKVWGIHARLRTGRIAHRELRFDHFLLPENGDPVLVDFSSGQIAANADLLNSDTAELLCATAIEVGPERAVRVAADVLGTEVLAEMSGRLQPLALSRRTRKQLSAHNGLLGDLQAEVQRVAGIGEVEYEELARLSGRTIFTIVVLAVAAYVLIPQFAKDTKEANFGDILASANWLWTAPLLLFMVGSWVGASIGIIGSVPDRVPFLPMFKSQVAASFADLLAPAALGGMALSSRFLQKRGVDPARAVAGVGLNAVAGFVAHVVLLGVFLLWAGGDGQDTQQPLKAPDARWIVLGLVVLVVLIGGAFVIPFSRNLVSTRLAPFLRDAGHGLRELARQPLKLLALVGGSATVTLSLYGALYCALRTFDLHVPAAGLGVAYLLASTVTVFAFTPGAVGPLELTLILALQGLGLTRSQAVNSVLVFRIGTFWLPLLPGWLCFRSMQRREEI